MKKSLRACLLVASLPLLASCIYLTTQIRTSEIEGSVSDVTSRHDAYVREDDSLTSRNKQLYLLESQELRALTADNEKVTKTVLASTAATVLDRHDRYVEADDSLIDLEKRVFSSSSQSIRSVYEENHDDATKD